MTGYDSVDAFNLALIEEAHVVTVVGSSFGIPDCLRFSYAVDEETFAEGNALKVLLKKKKIDSIKERTKLLIFVRSFLFFRENKDGCAIN